MIPLDGESIYLPSVVYAPRIEPPKFDFDEREFDKEYARLKREDLNRVRKEQQELENNLEVFKMTEGPKIELAPKRYEYSTLASFEVAQKRYLERRKQYLHDLEEFRQTRFADQMRSMRQFMRPALTELELKRLVRSILIRRASEERNREYWDQTFLSVLESNESSVLFGSEAISAYAEDPQGGFFMRSPKAFLGSDLLAGYRKFFVKLIGRTLRHIKQSAEQYTNTEFESAVIGRPVSYLGTQNASGNAQAIEIMREAASIAGFVSVSFVYEPMAASFTIDRNELGSFGKFLIVDIGGGTTDCVAMGVDHTGIFKVLSVSGSRIGGNDFDEAIALNLLMPLCGKGQRLKSNLTAPLSLFADAISIRDVPAQLRFRKSNHRIDELLREVEDKSRFERLFKVSEYQLQHQLVASAEESKIGVSVRDPYKLSLDYLEEGLVIDIDRSNFVVANQFNFDRIIRVVDECIESAGLTGPILTFVTGGLSYSRDVMLALREGLPPGSQLATLPAMSAVCAGLGEIANRLSSYPHSSMPERIRGVPILN